MYDNNKKLNNGFPDPLAEPEIKLERDYGLQYAKAIESQWGKLHDTESTFSKRNSVFERNRKYAKGTQDTSIYKQLLHSLDTQDGDGSLLNLDYTPVPILPKFKKVVVNKILSRDPYPNLEAIDPFSSSEKNKEKRKIMIQVEARKQLAELKNNTGAVLGMDPDSIPESPEEAELFFNTNIKNDAEIAAQIATNLTLSWNNFNDNIYRRCVEDIASIGMAVTKRSNDPNYGIKVSYVDPARFVHSYTEDPNFDDITYAGHIKRITISELRRISNGELDEAQLKKIAQKVKHKNGNNGDIIDRFKYDDRMKRNVYGYDEYMVDVLDFEFISVDSMYFEEKQNKYGNTNFFYKGFDYKERPGSVFKRTPKMMTVEQVYSGSYILDCDEYLFGYGKSQNMPKNIHDLTRVSLSYSAVSTNIDNMVPKSMIDSCIGFADMLQLTHLKIQQAIAKSKPDGLIIDIEGLENVQLGSAGELEPLQLHDIYEKTGVFYYRSKNPEGGFQNPPIREIGNTIRNINELIALYNHYLRIIRDVTGINDVMDASSPKGEALVGVREQALAAGNNATYDISNAALILFKKVCMDIVKCIQIIHPESVLFKMYTNAIGEENMSVITSFGDLPMYNFGVQVVKEMEDKDKQYLEQNIQISLQQKELDIEDAISIRNMKDVNQAEQLLIIKRKKRIERMQQMASQNSQAQAQAQAQATQAQAQMEVQKMQMQAEIEVQKMQLKAQLDAQFTTMKHEFDKEIAIIKTQGMLGLKENDKEFKEKLEVFKENRKDDRVVKQANAQSQLIDKRKNSKAE